MTCPNCESHAMDTVVALTILADVRQSMGVGDVPMLSDLPGLALRIRQERDDLRAHINDLSLALDMPGATPAELVRVVEGMAWPPVSLR